MSDDTTSNPAEAAEFARAEAVVDLEEGAEAGVARFCEEAFVSPESARNGATALLNAFDNSGLWLSNLVQPSHLLAELRQSCSILTRVIVTQWTHQGETHKLSRLGAAVLDAEPPTQTHEAGQVMALLASLLGVLKPPRAQSLLEASRPLLRDSTDLPLLKEANEWVEIGCVVEELTMEDRIFWNRRLRDPTEEWEWDTAEARGALRRIAPFVKVLEDEDLTRFQQTVPGCWWDALHDSKATALPSNEGRSPPEQRRRLAAVFGAGVLVGAISILVSFLLSGSVNNGGSEVERGPANHGKTEAHETLDLGATQAQKFPQIAQRLTELTKLEREHANLQRLHNLVKSGSLRENDMLIRGRASMAPLGSRDYSTLIRWLMLDPADSPEVRLAVAKIATRALPPDELLSTLKLCIYPGSPNDEAARACAGWSLELDSGNLTAAQKRELTALPKPLTKS